ncbi:MAG: chemotaxis protein CheA [Planctomycetota bacterium]|jgi:two-component system chemotaxis sensor kinase CheA|nr:chemotaxis protein CheA [Planctomycetota bacterium]
MADEASPDISGIDPALLQDFISESQEILDGLDPLFVALESSPEDLSIVDGIFRPVHSVKGNSGFFGLTNIKNFAHIMENILGEIRARKRQATPPLIDVLLKGVDFLRGMINRLAQGNFSGQLLPEEQTHLEILNHHSSAGGAKDDDTPEAKARNLLKAFTEAMKNRDDAGLVGRLDDSIKTFIRATLPGFLSNEEAQGKPESVIIFRVGDTDISAAVHGANTFVDELERNEKEEALCESFLQSLQTIGEASLNVAPDIIPLVEQIKDDFITIHDSGIGFDALMTSLIRERLDAILGHVEKVEMRTDGDFILNGEVITETVNSIHAFINDIKTAEKDPAKSEAFVNAITSFRNQAGDKKGLIQAAEQILDDYLTIHESGIGFDDLIQSLISDRFTAVLSFLDRGGVAASAKANYRLGSTDLTAQAELISAFVKDAKTQFGIPAANAKFLSALQEIAQAAQAAEKADEALAAQSLRDDLEGINGSGVGLDKAMEEMLATRVATIIEGLEKVIPEVKVEVAAAEAPSEAAPAAAAAPAPASKPDADKHGSHELSGKTLRVAEEKVDHFMSFVGELIIIGEVFAYIQKKLESYPEARPVAQEFKNANLTFSDLSSNLQKSLMEVRRVPLKSVLQKLHRIIRDTASQLGKKIDLEIIGEDVQIDKSLLEGLESPLVHMVRNSVDHGVELPADRKAAGKGETGKVAIIATATEEQFSLVIKDDGKGLDLEAIKNKAVTKNLISEDAARTMPDKEAFRLIFNAGLSTAKVVTDVSGRGVGMDVVLSNITKMNGNITVDSVKGEGSAFTITLPMTVTLTVIDGLVAKIGDQDYIIPLSDVRESVRPKPDQVHTIRGSQKVLNVRGELHPIVHLTQVLGISAEHSCSDPCDGTVVLVHGKKDSSAAFLVDDIIGQQSVVVKELGKEFENIRCIQGGSILGDGRVGLVLNVQGILIDIGIAAEES